jgi:SAM-dependent methyltransferase
VVQRWLPKLPLLNHNQPASRDHERTRCCRPTRPVVSRSSGLSAVQGATFAVASLRLRILRASGNAARLAPSATALANPSSAGRVNRAARSEELLPGDSAELFSAVAESLSPGDRLLDLGCGSGDQVPVAAHYGLRYAGVDYSSPKAGMLADAHALPFSDASFDHVLSYVVFEHLHNPYMAATEVARVLAPRGLFFGAVSQGEPFHESYFHHTALGVLALLHATGFSVRRLWPSYDTLHALAVMGRYPRVSRSLIEILYRFVRATPFLAPRAFFRSSQRDKELEAVYRAASICFVAERVEHALNV